MLYKCCNVEGSLTECKGVDWSIQPMPRLVRQLKGCKSSAFAGAWEPCNGQTLKVCKTLQPSRNRIHNDEIYDLIQQTSAKRRSSGSNAGTLRDGSCTFRSRVNPTMDLKPGAPLLEDSQKRDSSQCARGFVDQATLAPSHHQNNPHAPPRQ